MKKVILGLILVSNILLAKDVTFYGAFYGDLKSELSSWSTYPTNDIGTAGLVYLYKKKIEKHQFIYNKKSQHISNAIKEAKKYAKENNYSKCAIDNIEHQVIISKNEVVVMTNYNVIAFEEK